MTLEIHKYSAKKLKRRYFRYHENDFEIRLSSTRTCTPKFTLISLRKTEPGLHNLLRRIGQITSNLGNILSVLAS